MDTSTSQRASPAVVSSISIRSECRLASGRTHHAPDYLQPPSSRGNAPAPATVGLCPLYDEPIRTGALKPPIGVYRITERITAPPG